MKKNGSMYLSKTFAMKEVDEYVKKKIDNTDKRLVANFHKCCEFVKEHCNFNIESRECFTYHSESGYWFVEDGNLFFAMSDNGCCGYNTVVSPLGTDTYTQGSCQGDIYRYQDVWFFNNECLIHFFKAWDSIATEILNRKRIYNSFKVC